MDWFYYNANGVKIGPISVAILKESVKSGVIKRDTIVENANGRSAKAECIKGLVFPTHMMPFSVPVPKTVLPVPHIESSTAEFSPNGNKKNAQQITPNFHHSTPIPPPLPTKTKVISTPYIVGGVISFVVMLLWIVLWIGGVFSSREPVAVRPGKTVEREVLATSEQNHIAKPLSTDQIIAFAEASVANLRGKSGSGTGFMIEQNILITNKHVIDEEYINDIDIHFPSANPTDQGPFKSKLIYSDPKRDVSFLCVSTPHPQLRFDNKSAFKRGQDIVVIGNPGFGKNTLQNAVSKGVISTEMEIDGEFYWQMGISINSGNSGGPVFDNNGNVVGIATLKATKQEGVAFCIPPVEIASSLKIAKEQTEAQIEENNAMHDVIAFFVGITKTASKMLIVMEVYDKAMTTAIIDRKTAQEGVDIAKKEIGNVAENLADDCKSKHQSALKQIMQSSRISQDIKSNLADYWTNFMGIDRYVNRTPSTNADRFRDKRHEFSDKHEELKTRLCISLGINEDDLE